MKRYAAPLVLCAWSLSEALGCNGTVVGVAWLALLLVAVVLQVRALAEFYTHHRRGHRWPL